MRHKLVWVQLLIGLLEQKRVRQMIKLQKCLSLNPLTIF